MSRKGKLRAVGEEEAVPVEVESVAEMEASIQKPEAEAPEGAPEPAAFPAKGTEPPDRIEALEAVPELSGVSPGSLEAALAVCRHFRLPPRDGFARVLIGSGAGGRRAVFVLGYRGMAWLARVSGLVAQLDARVIRQRDTFALDQGRQFISHAPYDGTEDPGPVTGAYCQIVFKDGAVVLEHVSGRDVVERYGWAETVFPKLPAEEVFRKAAIERAVQSSPFDLRALSSAIRAEANSVAGAPISLV